MDKKFCDKCGAPLEEGDEFCRHCGARVDASISSSPSETIKQETTSNNATNPSSGTASNSVNTRTSYVLSIVGLSIGGASGIIDIVSIFIPMNSVFLKLINTSLELGALGLIFSIVALCLNKKSSYKDQLSKVVSIVGIVVSAIALIGYFILFIIALVHGVLY